MNVDEKVHALQSDVLNWTKAKNRVHYALPKVREFIHRATWATAAAERKRLEEVVKNHIEPRVPFAEMDQTREQMEHLQKDRQVLFSAEGGTRSTRNVRAILGEFSGRLARSRETQFKRHAINGRAGRDKGKHL